MHIQRQSEAFAYRMATAPTSHTSFDQGFVDNLRKEFRDWWVSGEGQAAFRQHPRVKPYFDYDLTQDNPDPDEWKAFRGHEREYQRINNEMKRRGPIGWWPNVENFLQAKYPAANKNHQAGWEEAGHALDNPHQEVYGKSPYETGPDAIAQHGYDPAEVAAGMVLLHNQSHPTRGRLETTDKQRLVDIFNKRQKMQQDYEQRQKIAAAALTQDIVDRLDTEFHDWYFNKPGRQKNYDDFQGPIGNWKNIENFLKENYPASHRGLDMGMEEATPLLDGDKAPQYVQDAQSDVADYRQRIPAPEGSNVPYETGPQAVSQYGYDPKEIAAGMLMLHNQSHPGRGDEYFSHDLDRLFDIAQKRQQMQQDYEKRQLVTAALTQDIVDRLGKEFDEWWGDREHEDADDAWPGRGPIGHWPNVEDFLYDKYPAAHRGYETGFENAAQVLDYGQRTPWSEDESYETGPEAVYDYGYDPKEVAAGMILLHNQTHPFRGFMEQSDQDRLVDIFNKRQKMQRDFDKRMKQQGEQQALFSKDELLNPNKYEEQKQLVTASNDGGDCYEAAAKHIMENSLFAGPEAYKKNKHLRLVHGEVAGQGPLEGKTFGHAWVEDGNDVIDNANGRNLRMPKMLYYHFGNIDRIGNYHVYTPEEVRDKMIEHRHYGPWDLQGKHTNYISGPQWEDDEDDEDEEEWWG